MRSSLPSLEHVLVIGEPGAVRTLAGTRDLRALIAEADSQFTIPATDPTHHAMNSSCAVCTRLP